MARVSTKEPPPFPEPSEDWVGSRPEWAVYYALLRLGMKGKFTYQSPQLGGRTARGGAVLDFYLPSLDLAINVQSAFYHYASTPQQARGEMQKIQLENMGIRVIYIEEEDALREPIYYVREALAGRSHSKI